uniref:Predicted phosphoesterase, NUDIX family n=1 Tax=Candidatus Kentrum sp. TC TaxID=2126339 RepID=A0A450ZX27_9GAMM|nr:MAG: Predicted phosphoesterase, NUDIX family [Candidatus Kentron sp. TC]
MDRGIFDALCWFNWLVGKNKFDERNFKDIERFLVMTRWRSVIDFIYVFTANPKVSLEREFSTLLTRKMGSIMHPDILMSYKETIEYSKKKYTDLFKTIEGIDTSGTVLNELNYKVTKNILDILERNTSEKIGYLNRDAVPRLDIWFPFDKIDILRDLEFDIRSKVEDDDKKLQPIPILVITNKEKTRVLVAKKNKKQTPPDSPESKKLLLYFGGHIREEDRIESEKKDLLSVSRYALHREVKEETGIDYYPDREYSPICIWDGSNDKSKKHLAMCYVMETDLDTLKPKIDKNEFANSGNTRSGKVLDVQKIEEIQDDLEAWGKIIFKNILNSSSKQMEIDLRVG